MCLIEYETLLKVQSPENWLVLLFYIFLFKKAESRNTHCYTLFCNLQHTPLTKCTMVSVQANSSSKTDFISTR